MKLNNIILQINQGLVKLGQYAGGSLLEDEVKQALDVELKQLFNDVISKQAVETTGFTAALLNDLKDSYAEDKYVLHTDYLEYSIPQNSELILRASIEIIYLKDYNKPYLEIGKSYKPKVKAKINGFWTDKITLAVDEYYTGVVKQVEYYTFPIRIVSSQEIDEYRNKPFTKTKLTSPLGELENKKLKVYLEDCIPNSVKYSFYKTPILFSNLPTSAESPYSDIVNTELIKNTIINIKQR